MSSKLQRECLVTTVGLYKSQAILANTSDIVECFRGVLDMMEDLKAYVALGHRS